MPGRFCIVARSSTAVTRGLDPWGRLLHIDFERMMDARVKPVHDDRADQTDRDLLTAVRSWGVTDRGSVAAIGKVATFAMRSKQKYLRFPRIGKPGKH